jgi:hypothetical protein
MIGICEGPLGLDDAKAGARAVWEDPNWRAQPVVWDFRGAKLNLSTADVRAFVEFILEEQPAARPPRVAMVTGTDVDFGMARMFGAYREHPSTQVRVFRDYDDAVTWAQSGSEQRPST